MEQTMKYCHSCGASMGANSEFCPSCGARQSVSAENVAPISAIPAQSSGFLGTKKRKLLAGAGGILILLLCICMIGTFARPPGGDEGNTQAKAAVSQSGTPKPTNTPNPTNTPKPTSTPKPTNTPKPPDMLIDYSGTIEPKILRVGEKLVIKLRIENKSERELSGFRVISHGPWDKYTIANMIPGGTYDTGLFGGSCWFETNFKLAAGETIFFNLIVYPNEAGNHEFDFALNTLDSFTGSGLTTESGEKPSLSGSVAVLR